MLSDSHLCNGDVDFAENEVASSLDDSDNFDFKTCSPNHTPLVLGNNFFSQKDSLPEDTLCQTVCITRDLDSAVWRSLRSLRNHEIKTSPRSPLFDSESFIQGDELSAKLQPTSINTNVLPAFRIEKERLRNSSNIDTVGSNFLPYSSLSLQWCSHASGSSLTLHDVANNNNTCGEVDCAVVSKEATKAASLQDKMVALTKIMDVLELSNYNLKRTILKRRQSLEKRKERNEFCKLALCKSLIDVKESAECLHLMLLNLEDVRSRNKQLASKLRVICERPNGYRVRVPSWLPQLPRLVSHHGVALKPEGN